MTSKKAPAKRKKARLPYPPPPPDLEEQIRAAPMQGRGRRGLSQKFMDAAFWLEDLPQADHAWVEALAAIDKSGGKMVQPLIECLRSNQGLSPFVRHCLVDLLKRYRFDAANSVKATALKTLQSKRPFAESEMTALVTMFERHELARMAHKPPVPFYDLSDDETVILMAMQSLKEQRKTDKNMRRRKTPLKADARLLNVAERFRIRENALERAMTGNRGSARVVEAKLALIQKLISAGRR